MSNLLNEIILDANHAFFMHWQQKVSALQNVFPILPYTGSLQVYVAGVLASIVLGNQNSPYLQPHQ